MAILFPLIAVLITLVFVYFHWSFKYWERRKVPYIPARFPFGSVGIPFISKNGFGFRVKEFYNEFKHKGNKYGGFYVGTSPVLLTVCPDLVKAVLSKDFQHFSSQGANVNEKVDPMSAALFNMDGPKWKDMRAKLTPTFTSGKIKTMFQILLDYGDKLKDYIDVTISENKPLDMKKVLRYYTTDVICSSAFGLELNSFKNPNSEFLRAGERVFGPTRILLRRLLTVISPSLVDSLKFTFFQKDITNFFHGIIKDVVDHREKSNFKRNDFVQLLMDIKQKSSTGGKEDFTLDQMAAQSFGFFLAGFETSSTVMTFCLYELARRHDIQARIREEIKKTVEKYDGKLTYDGVMEMKYLNQVVNETLRKYPPVPVLQRQCTKDYTLSNGTVLKSGSIVFISTLGLHRDEEFFPNPDKFDPDRFTDDNKANIPSFAFIPFGEGPRICIGLRFGMMQTKVGLALLLKNYNIFPDESMKYPMNYDTNGPVLSSKDRLLIRAEKLC